MASTKQISAGVLLVGVLMMSMFAYATNVFAENEDKKVPLTNEERDAVVQNCSNIKQSLAKLQHSDSRTRTYLGTAYESINGRFITPLNLRLVKNNIPSAELFQVQSKFAAAQADFRGDYIDYMRELESLITVDCVLQPQEFYDKLEIVRDKRAKLRSDTQELAELAQEQYKSVEELQKSL